MRVLRSEPPLCGQFLQPLGSVSLRQWVDHACAAEETRDQGDDGSKLLMIGGDHEHSNTVMMKKITAMMMLTMVFTVMTKMTTQ